MIKIVSEEFQKKYLNFHVLKQQLEAMVEQKKIVDQKMEELAVTKNALENMVEIKKGSEIWSTLGSGAFISSNINETDKVVVSIGAGVAIKKKREEALEIIKSRVKELQGLEKEMDFLLEKNAMQAGHLEQELQEMAEKENE